MGLESATNQQIDQIGVNCITCMDDKPIEASSFAPGQFPKLQRSDNWAPLTGSNGVWGQDAAVNWMSVSWGAANARKTNGNWLHTATLEEIVQKAIYEYSPRDKSMGLRHFSMRQRVATSPLTIVVIDDPTLVSAFKGPTQQDRHEQSLQNYRRMGIDPPAPYMSEVENGETVHTVFHQWEGDSFTTLKLASGERSRVDIERLGASKGHRGSSPLLREFRMRTTATLNKIIQADDAIPAENILLYQYDSTGPWFIQKGKEMVHCPALKHMYGEGELSLAYYAKQLNDDPTVFGLPAREDGYIFNIDTSDSDTRGIFIVSERLRNVRPEWHHGKEPTKKAGDKRKNESGEEPEAKKSGYRTKTGVASFGEDRSRWVYKADNLSKLRATVEWEFESWGEHKGPRLEWHQRRLKFGRMKGELYIGMMGGDYVDPIMWKNGLFAVKVYEAFKTLPDSLMERLDELNRSVKAFIPAENAIFFGELEAFGMTRTVIFKEIVFHVYKTALPALSDCKSLDEMRVLRPLVPSDEVIEHVGNMCIFQLELWKGAMYGKSWCEAAKHMFTNKEEEEACVKHIYKVIENAANAKKAVTEAKKAAK